MRKHIGNGLRGAALLLAACVITIGLSYLWLMVPVWIGLWLFGRSPAVLLVMVVWIIATVGFVIGVKNPPPRLSDYDE